MPEALILVVGIYVTAVLATWRSQPVHVPHTASLTPQPLLLAAVLVAACTLAAGLGIQQCPV